MLSAAEMARPHLAKLAGADGQVTRAAFTAKAAERFQRMDTNRDGKIDAAERQAGRERFKQRRG